MSEFCISEKQFSELVLTNVKESVTLSHKILKKGEMQRMELTVFAVQITCCCCMTAKHHTV